MGTASLATRLRIIPVYAALFFTIGVALPYWPTWLESRGIPPEVIGVLLGIGPWVRFGLNPSVGRFADRRGLAHRLVCVGAAILALSYVGMLFVGGSVALIAALVLFGAVGFGPLVPLADSVVLRAEGVDYGRLRAWGSGAFIVASFTGGLLLDEHGADAILLSLLACAVTMVLTALVLPAPPPRPASQPASVSSPALDDTRPSPNANADADADADADAWKVPGFAAFLATVALLNGSHAALYGFGTLHWRATGISEADIGVLWSVSVIAEIALFMVGGWLSARVGVRGLLGLAAAGGVVRWLLLAASPDFAVLLAAQCLHALTFAAMHMGVMNFVQRRVPEDATAHATSLYSAIATGITLGVLMPLSGLIYGRFAGGVFVAMALLSTVALVVVALSPARIVRERPTRAVVAPRRARRASRRRRAPPQSRRVPPSAAPRRERPRDP